MVLAELRGIRSSSGQTNASSPRKPKFKFSETSDLHNSLPSLIRAKPQVVSKPDWFQHRLLLAGTKLHTVSNETGAVSVPVSLPAGASPEPVDFRDNRPVFAANLGHRSLWCVVARGRPDAKTALVEKGRAGRNRPFTGNGRSLRSELYDCCDRRVAAVFPSANRQRALETTILSS